MQERLVRYSNELNKVADMLAEAAGSLGDRVAAGETDPVSREIFDLSRRLLQISRELTGDTLPDSGHNDFLLSLPDDTTIRRIIGIIYQNLGRTEFTVNALSKAMGMSRINLYLKIREKTRMTPVELIRAVRMHEAARMLREGNSNVSEVAYMVGYNETRYFSRYFKAAFGILPSAFSRKFK